MMDGSPATLTLRTSHLSPRGPQDPHKLKTRSKMHKVDSTGQDKQIAGGGEGAGSQADWKYIWWEDGRTKANLLSNCLQHVEMTAKEQTIPPVRFSPANEGAVRVVCHVNHSGTLLINGKQSASRPMILMRVYKSPGAKEGGLIGGGGGRRREGR